MNIIFINGVSHFKCLMIKLLKSFKIYEIFCWNNIKLFLQFAMCQTEFSLQLYTEIQSLFNWIVPIIAVSILLESITHSAREQQFLFSIPKHFAVYASREFSERYWFSTSIRNFWGALRVYFECKKWPTAVRGLISHLIKPLNGGSGPATICHYIKWNSAVEKRFRRPRYCCGWITFRIPYFRVYERNSFCK